MGEQGLNAKMFSGDSMNNVELWTIAGPAAQNMFFTFAPEPRNIPEAKAIVDEFKKAGYDPDVDFAPLAQLVTYEFACAVAKNVPAKDLRELIAWLKANPDKIPGGTA